MRLESDPLFFGRTPVPGTGSVADGSAMYGQSLLRKYLASSVIGIFLAAVVSTILLVVGPSSQASAQPVIAPFRGHGHHPRVNAIGGRHSKEAFIINSPSWSHDFQHVRTINVDGNTVGLAAACKRRQRFCKIVQRVVANDP
jgi:hypothetical protein